MKHHQHSTPVDLKTTSSQVAQWTQALSHLHARIAPHFARPEPRRRALLYLQGLLSEIPRKNGWQLAEHARETTPYGMQRLLSQAVWDTDLVRDDLRSYVLERFGREQAIVAIDETSFPKRGRKSAGVQVQYCGTTGQVENCQVGVFLDYITAAGHALIDRELYLPLSWTQDPERCREADIPDTIRFQTKCELAIQMMERIWKAKISIAWVVADTVYGGNLDLRIWLERHQYRYVMAVPSNEVVGIRTPDGVRRRVEVWEGEQRLLHEEEWQRLSMSQGTKGPRLFDWARVPVLHQWEDDEQHFLLIRRAIDDPSQRTYYLAFAPAGTTLQEMVVAIGARWRIEEAFEASKDMGLDHYQIRSFVGWYRHITLVLLAYAYLCGICAQSGSTPCLVLGAPSSPALAGSCDVRPVLPLTVPEVRHLLGRLIWPASSAVTFVLGWSWWRRHHRSCASYFHMKRRLNIGSSWEALALLR